MLEQLREQNEYSAKEGEQIMARIDAMVAQVPAVIMQAHERIIGKRNAPNTEKILSVYEPEGHLIVRSKAGKEVEFGNSLFLCGSAARGLRFVWEDLKSLVSLTLLRSSPNRQQPK